MLSDRWDLREVWERETESSSGTEEGVTDDLVSEGRAGFACLEARSERFDDAVLVRSCLRAFEDIDSPLERRSCREAMASW